MKKNDSNNENMKDRVCKSGRIVKLLLPLFILAAIVLILSYFAFEFNIFGFREKVTGIGKTEYTTEDIGISEEIFEVTQLTDEETAALLAQVTLPDAEAGETEDASAQEQLPEEPITTQEICLTDIYAPSGSEVRFKCYHEDATNYRWEYYDIEQKEWMTTDEADIEIKKDELFREVSTCKMIPTAHGRDMVRCSIEFSDGREVVNTASLYSLPEKIATLQIADMETEVNSYLDTLHIPVTVSYESGASETLTGLYGLYFLDVKEAVEYEESISGNKIEQQIVTITECNYFLASSDTQEVTVRYMDGTIFEEAVNVTGIDKTAPVIADVKLGEYVISNTNKIVPIEISIEAEDNETPYPYLEYAFVHESVELTEEHFHTEASFTADIDMNGTWIAYVRDENGNTAKAEEIIYAVDEKAPELRLEVQNVSWCRENIIAAIGEDKTELKYKLQCNAQDIEGEWTSDSSFTVKENGVYVVSAMDAAGNVTTEEITISNIDNKAPVIIGIKEVGGSNEK